MTAHGFTPGGDGDADDAADERPDSRVCDASDDEWPDALVSPADADETLTLVDDGAFALEREYHVRGETIDTGDIRFFPADDDLPEFKLASFTPSELAATARECDACDLVAAGVGYTHFCTEHRAEAALTALTRSGL